MISARKNFGYSTTAQAITFYRLLGEAQTSTCGVLLAGPMISKNTESQKENRQRKCAETRNIKSGDKFRVSDTKSRPTSPLADRAVRFEKK
jgi:hypothetical protein